MIFPESFITLLVGGFGITSIFLFVSFRKVGGDNKWFLFLEENLKVGSCVREIGLIYATPLTTVRQKGNVP